MNMTVRVERKSIVIRVQLFEYEETSKRGVATNAAAMDREFEKDFVVRCSNVTNTYDGGSLIEE